MEHSPLIFVVYDGIQNSVFASQVVQPLLKRLALNPKLIIWIISFEKNVKQAQRYAKTLSPTLRIQFLLYKKLPFIGSINLRIASFKIRRWLRQYKTYELIARGPLAGFICKQIALKNNNIKFTIQVRGLLTEEYVFCNESKEKKIFARLWYQRKKRQFSYIEQCVYAEKNQLDTYHIEVVSSSLKKYLIDNFKSNSEKITLAHADIPPTIDPTNSLKWRAAIRKKLEIPAQAHVFCYNGSAKPWQCPKDTLEYFKTEHEKNANCFLLVLTQDVSTFEQLALHIGLDNKSIHITQVPHPEMYHYLAACDVGLVFRESHLINWISRPVKVLEYHAAGLKIVHNNTIGYLVENEK